MPEDMLCARSPVGPVAVFDLPGEDAGEGAYQYESNVDCAASNLVAGGIFRQENSRQAAEGRDRDIVRSAWHFGGVAYVGNPAGKYGDSQMESECGGAEGILHGAPGEFLF